MKVVNRTILKSLLNLARDSIMEVPVTTEAMDMTAEDVGYNEKIVVETEKIDGNEDAKTMRYSGDGKGRGRPIMT